MNSHSDTGAIDLGSRTSLDYALLAIVVTALLGFVGLGIFGSFTGFLQTAAYARANDIVSITCALISAGCAAYLALELVAVPPARLVFGLCIISAMFGYFAVSKGLPAAFTLTYGKPGHVLFDITRFDWGGKGCADTVVAENPAFEDFRQCSGYFDGAYPQVGRQIEVVGTVSDWGIARDSYRVIP